MDSLRPASCPGARRGALHNFNQTITNGDHEHLTYRHNGRDYRLTDVAGNIVKGILS